jgi:hypothetical protein
VARVDEELFLNVLRRKNHRDQAGLITVRANQPWRLPVSFEQRKIRKLKIKNEEIFRPDDSLIGHRKQGFGVVIPDDPRVRTLADQERSQPSPTNVEHLATRKVAGLSSPEN